jgi:SAM domain (Sterile alpha motif)
MDLAVWLRSLGLEQYEAAFRENAITEKLLPSLTAEDLKDLGVSIVGHRRALLNAIADLRPSTNTINGTLISFCDGCSSSQGYSC